MLHCTVTLEQLNMLTCLTFFRFIISSLYFLYSNFKTNNEINKVDDICKKHQHTCNMQDSGDTSIDTTFNIQYRYIVYSNNCSGCII